MSGPRAVLSVDFELFSHLPAYREARGTTADADVGNEAIDGLLAALDEHGARATFFVVSDIADRYPIAPRKAAKAGHEIGSHTHSHRHLPTLDPEERLQELSESRELLERVTDAPVTGFRAPTFSTSEDHFELLAKAGYAYDSSVVPSRRIPGLYGGEQQRMRPGPARAFDGTATDAILELPVGVMPGLRLPLSGAWLRLLGVTYTLAGMRLLGRMGIVPVLYIHPWEFLDLPAVDGVPKRVYWRTGDWMWRALERILSQPFEFVAARTVVEDLPTGGA